MIPGASRSHEKVSGGVISSTVPPAWNGDTLNHLSTKPRSPLSSSVTSFATAWEGSRHAPPPLALRPAFPLPTSVLSCQTESIVHRVGWGGWGGGEESEKI